MKKEIYVNARNVSEIEIEEPYEGNPNDWSDIVSHGWLVHLSYVGGCGRAIECESKEECLLIVDQLGLTKIQ